VGHSNGLLLYAPTAQVRSMLSPILRAKYPSITPEEEAISVPLQAMAGAIFDAVLVHMMNQLAPDTWQPLREDMWEKLREVTIVRIALLGNTVREREWGIRNCGVVK